MRIVLFALYITVAAGISPMLAQQTYPMYIGEETNQTRHQNPTASMHIPTFFTTGHACLAATEYKIYEPRDITRLGAWMELVENKEAELISFPFDICAMEQTAMGQRIIRIPANTPLFVKDGKIAADGRCGNHIAEIFLPPQPARPAPPPPPVVRQPEPEPERPAPAPPVVARTPEPEPHSCPTCKMEIDVNHKAKVIRLTAKASEGYMSGIWSIGGVEIGRGATLLVSHDRLLKLAGKGESEIEFTSQDDKGHLVVCKGSITLQQTKKGRFWLFKLPGLNCLYAWTVDIKNWHLGGTVEKLGCLAAGAGIYLTLPGGAAANVKYWVPGR